MLDLTGNQGNISGKKMPFFFDQIGGDKKEQGTPGLVVCGCGGEASYSPTRPVGNESQFSLLENQLGTMSQRL